MLKQVQHDGNGVLVHL